MLTITIAAVCLAAIGNLTWAALNWRIYHKTLKTCEVILLSADNIKKRAVALLETASKLAEKNATEYRVCEQCGRIVQGVCKDCISKVLVH